MHIKGSTLRALLLHAVLTFLWLGCDHTAKVTATHLKGSFDTQDFFKFIVKFGFQKAETHRPQDSFGYIYGNVTSEKDFHQPVTLVVLDKSTFVDFYHNRSLSIYGRELACQHMFRHVQFLAYDVECNSHGKRDFLRRVPCPKGQLCVDEDAPSNVIAGNQFTYVISEVSQPR